MVAQLEIVSSKVWRLKTFQLWQVEATVEYVVGQDEVSAKSATLERKDTVLVWQLYYTFDHTRDQALYGLYQGDVSS